MRTRPSAADVRVAVAVMPIALSAPFLARLRPERLHRLLEAHLWQRELPCSDERLLQIIDVVLRRAAGRGRNRCLVRGITAYRLLRGAGRDVHLVFGARLVGAEIDAHCWLSDGTVVIHEPSGPVDGFEEMFRLTPSGVVVR